MCVVHHGGLLGKLFNLGSIDLPARKHELHCRLQTSPGSTVLREGLPSSWRLRAPLLLSGGPAACVWLPAVPLCTLLQEERDLHPILVFPCLPPYRGGYGKEPRILLF